MSQAVPQHKGEFDVAIKLLVIGDTSVGKTCLLLRYCEDRYSSSFISTIGIDFKSKVMNIDGTRVRAQLWDTAGQERFRTITTSYFRGAHGIALAFDLTQRSSYQSIPSWLKQLTDNADEGVSVALVGTKSDLLAVKPADDPAVVSKAECEALAKQFSVPVFYTSAKLNEGIAEAFEWLARDALKKMQAGKAAAASGAGGGAGAGAAGGAGGASGVVKPGKDEKAGGASGCAC